nr:RNA-directed DNA polymerase, eukaryota [Tanacetum cinerariifolium]
MPRSGIESEQCEHLLDSLEGVMLNPSEDRWSWDLNGSGKFSVASARRYIDNNILPDISFKTRWIKEVPIKVNVHAWKDNNNQPAGPCGGGSTNKVGPAMYGPYGQERGTKFELRMGRGKFTGFYGYHGLYLENGKSASTPINTEKPLLKGDLKGGWGLNIPYGEEINMISGTQDSNCGSVVIISLSFRVGPTMYGPYGQERRTKFELCVVALCSSSLNFISAESFNNFKLTWQQINTLYNPTEKLMKYKFQMSSIDGKSTSTPIDTEKPLLKGDLRGRGDGGTNFWK